MRGWDGCCGRRPDRAAGTARAPRRSCPLEQRLAVWQRQLPPARPVQSRGALQAGRSSAGGRLHGEVAAAGLQFQCIQIVCRGAKRRQAGSAGLGLAASRRRLSTRAIDIPVPALVFLSFLSNPTCATMLASSKLTARSPPRPLRAGASPSSRRPLLAPLRPAAGRHALRPACIAMPALPSKGASRLEQVEPGAPPPPAASAWRVLPASCPSSTAAKAHIRSPPGQCVTAVRPRL